MKLPNGEKGDYYENINNLSNHYNRNYPDKQNNR